ncbi:MAG TPA: M36 family metallopeptidase, partial [Thermoanaerobaculia bacterium]
MPTFLWLSEEANLAGGGPISNGPERREIAAARGHLNAAAHLYNLTPTDVKTAVASTVFNTGRGPVIVKFTQSVGGIEIFREELNVVMTQALEPIALTGYITSQTTPAAIPGRSTWDVQPRNAAVSALQDSAARNFNVGQLTAAFSRDGYDFYNVSGDAGVAVEPVRMKKVWFHLQDGLIPAYYIEAISSPVLTDVQIGNVEDSAYAYVISATDGAILFRKNLISEAANGNESNVLPPGGFTYRVWADPVTGIPYDTPAGNGVHPKLVPSPDGAQHSFVPTQDVTLPNFPFSMNDPWLAPGATETNGNNVDAFVNINSPDGLGNPITTTPTDFPNGDHRAQITGAGQFLHNHTPDVDAFSASARSGSISQLFYNINFLHDWFYDSGFNEANRNGQKLNFGRGGLEADDMKAQSGDFQSFNNANMLTPADGQRSRMRMYNFPNLANTLDVTAPAGIALKNRIGVSQTGLRSFDITSDIVIATFTAGPTTCTITNAAALTGKIAMFDFDNTDGTGCSFSTRIARIHATSAAAALMVYTSGAPTLVANITGFNATHTKPIGVISWNSAGPIKTQLAVPNTVSARLLRKADRDGSLDNQIVFHEWGHFISNRLIGNASGLNNQQGGSMGEGWGDFVALMLTVRENDIATPSNATWGGAYALATYATSGVPFDGSLNHGYYLGIRRTPYSTDMTNYNALTFRHIEDGQPAPTGPPIAWGGANSEVHNSGEVWTTMLWECYAALLRDTQGPLPRLTFAQAQDRMKQYLVASLAMTPSSPTFLEARDAVLAAAYATDLTDYILFWDAFAKRGAGLYAVAPDRYSTTHAGVVESFDAVPEIQFAGFSINDSVASCDNDGVLDSGDTGKLTVVIKNVGTSALVNTVATITSSTPGVSFPNGNSFPLPASDPVATVSGSVNVAYAAGIAGAQQLDFSISVYDPTLGTPRTTNWSVRANTNAIPASTATETVEHTSSPFTFTYNNTLPNLKPWARKEVSAMQHVFHVDDADGANDQYLTSPVFTVDGSGSMNVQFDHSWSFEFDGGGNYDGGVLEMSVNGGAWTDIGATIYNGTILNYAASLNPLKGRTGLVQASAGTVHSSLTQAIAPGSTVQVRWRFGSDNALGAPGWNVDNIAFSGVVETPFATVVADTGCSVPTATSLVPSANPSPFGASLTLTATVTSTGGTPTGNVTFYDGATNLGTSALVSGVATLATSSLAIG